MVRRLEITIAILGGKWIKKINAYKLLKELEKNVKKLLLLFTNSERAGKQES